MSKFAGNGWEILLEEGWESEIEEGMATFYHSNGFGALQISSYSKNIPVTEKDLKDLASDHINAGVKLKAYENNSSKVLTLAFGYEGVFWQYWYIAVGKTALVVTYNCDEDDRVKEIDIIKNMVSTINET